MTPGAPHDEPAKLPEGMREVLVSHGLENQPVRFAVASSTRVDTGGWLRGAALWAAVVGDRFVLASAGPRPYLRIFPVSALSRAVYNHVTGELAFPPVKSGPPVPSLRIDPFMARSLFDLLPSSSATGTPSSTGTPSHA